MKLMMAIEFDKTWHQRCYGDTPMPEDLCLATEYHSRAAMTMTIWRDGEIFTVTLELKQAVQN